MGSRMRTGKTVEAYYVGRNSVQRWTTFAIVAAFAMSGAQALRAQPVREVAISDVPTCADCRVVLEKVATLGTGRSDLGVFSQAIVRNRAGQYIVASYDMSSIVVYDAVGRELRAFGRDGDGPGEFRSVVDIQVGPGDSLYVHDMSRRGVKIFSTEGKYARTLAANAPQPKTGLVLADGGILVESKRGQLDLYCRDGELVANYAITPNAIDPRVTCRLCNRRALRFSQTPAQVWSFVRNKYLVERISYTGKVIERFSRAPRWFTALEEDPPNAAPVPRISGVYEDSTGHLWVLSHVPDAQWNPANGGVSGVRTTADYESLYATVVEVIDPASGRLVVSHKVPPMLSLLGDGSGFTFRELESGRVVIDVWRLRIVKSTGQ